MERTHTLHRCTTARTYWRAPRGMLEFVLRPLRSNSSLLPIEVATTPVTLGRRHKGVPDEPRFRAIHRQHCSLHATQEGIQVTQLGATPLARKRGFQLTTSSWPGDTLQIRAGDELHLLHPTHSSAAVGCVYVVVPSAGGQTDAPTSSERPRPAPVKPGVEDDSLEVTCGRRLVIKGRAGVVQQVEGASGSPDVLVLFDNGEEDLISYAGALRAVRAARLLPERAPAAAEPAPAVAPTPAAAPAPSGEAKHSSATPTPLRLGKGLKEPRAAAAEDDDEDKPLRAPKHAKKGPKPAAPHGTKQAALGTLDKGTAAKKRPRTSGPAEPGARPSVRFLRLHPYPLRHLDTEFDQ